MDAETHKTIPLTEDLLGFCTECIRVRWLRVLDGKSVDDGGEGMDGMPYGTCRQCAREAEDVASR